MTDFIQEGHAFVQTPSDVTIGASLTGVTSGSVLLAFISSDSAGGPPTFSMSDSQNNSWMQIGTTKDDVGAGVCLAVFKVVSAKGGNTAITGNLSAAHPYRNLIVMEYAAGTLDAHSIIQATCAGFSGDAHSPSITPIQNGSTVLACILPTSTGETITAPVGWTQRSHTAGTVDMMVADIVQSSPGDIEADFTINPASRYISFIIAKTTFISATDFQAFPDAEAMAADILRAANICSGRIYSSRPNAVTLPMAIVQRLGGLPSDRRAVDNPRIQVDIWGNSKSEARAAAEAAREALHRAEGTTFSSRNGYVNSVEDETGLTWLPDPETKEDRYVFGVIMGTRATRP